MRTLLAALILLGACRAKDAVVDSDVDDSGPVEVVDVDGDGVPADQDCDDADASVYPGAVELCNGVDDDCNGEADDGLGQTWYRDGDGDGYGVEAYTTEACEAPEGFVAEAGDCDDADAAYHPGATEDDCADPNDYNCDGSVGFADADGDGYPACEECDDGDRSVNPSATEVCDDVDNDCDGSTDEPDAADAGTWYSDADSDGFGDPASDTQACEAPSGYVADASDCDDSDGAVNPGADELCVTAADDDCDGEVNEDDAVDAATWYIDYDADGYGSSRITEQSCAQPSSFVDNSDDCDDTDDDIHPAASEVCDEVDNDCDALIDDDDPSLDTSTGSSWYADSDGDGFGDSSALTLACEQPSGLLADASDCDDTDAAIHPDAVEQCDGIDNDCDGSADAGALGLGPTCAAVDCQDILTNDPSAADGDYYIDPDSSGSAFEIFCDMTNDGGGWTLAANIDDVNDPWLTAQSTTWESSALRNETTLPSFTTDIAVTAKYRTWTSLAVTDVRVVYKNDSAYFLCEGLDVVDTLQSSFTTVAPRGSCTATCSSWSSDRLSESTRDPVGLNCNDPNEDWMNASALTPGENARIGGLATSHPTTVMNAFLGAAGDRGYSTSSYEKTWGAYSSGVVTDNNILLFVR